MDKRTLLQILAAAGVAAVIPPAADAGTSAEGSGPIRPAPELESLHPPVDSDIPVAFLLSDAAVVIDFAGPWEVFQDVVVPGRAKPNPFRPYTVAETMQPIKASGGLMVLPSFTLATAPPPKVLVIPAQDDASPAVLAWVRRVARTADVTMSVCTGAFLLAKAGLLRGKPATTHHGAYAELALAYPDIDVRRGARFVDTGNLASSGGLSSASTSPCTSSPATSATRSLPARPTRWNTRAPAGRTPAPMRPTRGGASRAGNTRAARCARWTWTYGPRRHRTATRSSGGTMRHSN